MEVALAAGRWLVSSRMWLFDIGTLSISFRPVPGTRVPGPGGRQTGTQIIPPSCGGVMGSFGLWSSEKTPDWTMSPGQTRGPTHSLVLPKTTGGKALCTEWFLSLPLAYEETGQRASQSKVTSPFTRQTARLLFPTSYE